METKLLDYNSQHHHEAMTASEKGLPRMICFRPGVEQNLTELTTRFQIKTTDPVILTNTSCKSKRNSDPLILLCGDKNYQNTTVADLPCQCPAADQPLSRSRINQLMCIDYSPKNLNDTARLVLSPRDIAEKKGSWSTLSILSRSYSQDNLIDIVQQLIKNNSTAVKETNSDSNYNALYMLCLSSTNQKIVQVAELLIDNGVNLNKNALMRLSGFSQSEKIVEMAELLISKGIELNQTGDSGYNALMWLCRFSSNKKIVQMAKLLIEKGINLNQTDKEGDNALMLLCLYSTNYKLVEVAKLLIEKGIDINQGRRGFRAVDLVKLRSTDDPILQKRLSATLELIMRQKSFNCLDDKSCNKTPDVGSDDN